MLGLKLRILVADVGLQNGVGNDKPPLLLLLLLLVWAGENGAKGNTGLTGVGSKSGSPVFTKEHECAMPLSLHLPNARAQMGQEDTRTSVRRAAPASGPVATLVFLHDVAPCGLALIG